MTLASQTFEEISFDGYSSFDDPKSRSDRAEKSFSRRMNKQIMFSHNDEPSDWMFMWKDYWVLDIVWKRSIIKPTSDA